MPTQRPTQRTAAIALLLFTTHLMAHKAEADNRIDGIRPDAPELAAYGNQSIGVTTLEVTNKDQVDILKVKDPGELPRSERRLTLEVFYPSKSADPTPLLAFIRDGTTEVELHGKASRDAEPDTSQGPYPLVIISHGFPGNRFLLSHLAENLASKGYVVASIDHTDSTYRDMAAFGSTLVNRSLDQIFVLNEMQRQNDGDSVLKGMVDTSSTALVGYSMGAYGAVITSGGGVTQAAVDLTWGAPAGTLAIHQAGSDSHSKLRDDRIKSIVAIAPWGMERGFWDADGLSGVSIPTLFVAGSADDVSGYENGIRAIWEQSTGAPRHLLTFEHANHNAAAPYPAPAESMSMNEKLGFAPFEHYADAVWDTTRMNNILQHFSTAFIARHVRGDRSMDAYLDLVPDSKDAVWAAEEDGTLKPEHNYWKGFQNRTAKGLKLEFKNEGE